MKWEKVKLGNIITLEYGKPLIKEDRKEFGVFKVYASGGHVGNHNECFVTTPTIVLGRKGSIGSITYSNDPCWVIDTAYYVKLKGDVNLRYLFYGLSQLNLASLNKAAAVPGLNRNDVYEKEIPLPPLHIQEQIADTLDKADALRRKDQELLQKYDELAQSIFYDMFGDPVMNDKGWEVKKLGSLSNHISSGSTPLGGQKVYKTSGVLFIRSQNVLMRSFDISDAVFIDEATHKKMKRTWVKHNDVLLNITGASIGRIAVYEGEDDCANVNQHVCIIRPLKNVIDPYFLMFMMSTDIFQNNIIGKSAGGTRESFTFEQIKQFDIIVPPIELQTRYNEFVQKISNQHNLASECSVETGKTFQAIMSEYFS